MIYKGDVLTKKVKVAYKFHLKLLKTDELGTTNPIFYHEGRAVYITETGVYQFIFSSWLKLVNKIDLCYLMHCLVLHGNFREEELISMGKIAFCSRDVCMILGYKNHVKTFQRSVKMSVGPV